MRHGSHRTIHWSLTLLGAIAFSLATRAWRDPYHLAYDVLTGLAFFSFLARITTDALERPIETRWWGRVLLLLLIGVVSEAALLLHWEISGHLTALIIVAGAQTLDLRLPHLLRVTYWIPVPIAVWLRWTIFDEGVHTETYSAAVVAALSVAAFAIWQRLADRRRPPSLTPPR